MPCASPLFTHVVGGSGPLGSSAPDICRSQPHFLPISSSPVRLRSPASSQAEPPCPPQTPASRVRPLAKHHQLRSDTMEPCFRPVSKPRSARERAAHFERC